VVSPTVIEELQTIAPTYVVRGNCDYAAKAPAKRVVPAGVGGPPNVGLLEVGAELRARTVALR